jgi:hypothetical protein
MKFGYSNSGSVNGFAYGPNQRLSTALTQEAHNGDRGSSNSGNGNDNDENDGKTEY